MADTACLQGGYPGGKEQDEGPSSQQLADAIQAAVASARQRRAQAPVQAKSTQPPQLAQMAQPAQPQPAPQAARWQHGAQPEARPRYQAPAARGIPPSALLSTPAAVPTSWNRQHPRTDAPRVEPVFVPNWPDDKVFSIDVECVSVGTTHETCSRSPCSVALVDCHCNVLFQAVIKPNVPVLSYLTPITGYKAEDLECGMRLEEAQRLLKSKFPSDAVLIGQHPDGDIEWMQLQRGRDYACSFDISEVFKGFNHRFGTTSYHSLQHEAEVLLQKRSESGPHDPVWDAQASIELYRLARAASPQQVQEFRQRLINVRPAPSIAKQLDYKYEGVCMAKFMPNRCICGMPCERNLISR